MLRAIPGEPGALEAVEAIREFTETDPQQVIAFSVLGGGADLGIMALGPDLDALDILTKRVLAGPVEAVYSFVSLTEHSEYTSGEADERARLEAEGEADIEGAIARWSARMETYLDARLHPRMPEKACIAFYPMSKRRVAGDNWYSLPFEERKRLLHLSRKLFFIGAGSLVQNAGHLSALLASRDQLKQHRREPFKGS